MSSIDTGTEAAVVAAGRAVWGLAVADAHLRLEAADDLILALDTYDAIHAGAVNPVDRWPELEHDPEPWDEGLRRAAEAVLGPLAEVIRATPALARGHVASGFDDWHVEGVVECPRCGLYFDFCGTPQDLHDFITAHDCAKERGQQ